MVAMSRSIEDNPIQPRRLTRAEARSVDGYVIETLGLPGLVLMENAGLNAAGAIMDLLKAEFVVDEDSARVSIVCGGGNNAGDGYVIARHLLAWGLSPTVYSLKPVEELDGDAAVNAKAWLKLGQGVEDLSKPGAVGEASERWRQSHVVVDAVLGTGFSDDKAPMRPGVAAVVRAISELRQAPESAEGGGFLGRIVAVDVPSGLDCDTGRPAGGEAGAAVRADLTITFMAEKAGFAAAGAGRYVGRVVVADIGVPEAVVEAAIDRVGRPDCG